MLARMHYILSVNWGKCELAQTCMRHPKAAASYLGDKGVFAVRAPRRGRLLCQGDIQPHEDSGMRASKRRACMGACSGKAMFSTPTSLKWVIQAVTTPKVCDVAEHH